MAGSVGNGLAHSKGAVGHDSEYRVFQPCGLDSQLSRAFFDPCRFRS
jgi:hypothetical protein